MAKLMITRRGSKWQYRFYVGKVDGKQKFISKSGFPTQKEAQSAGTEALYEFESKGVRLKNTNISVSDFCDLWIENQAVFNYKRNTINNYIRIIESRIKPVLGFYKLTDINTLAIQNFINDIKKEGLGKNRTSEILKVLSVMLNYAVDIKYIKTNPCKDVKLPKFSSPENKRYIITKSDINKILDRFKDSRFYIPILIGYYTGFRIGEVFGLTWEDVDFENKTLTVNKALSVEDGGRVFIDTPKTEKSNRTIKVSDFLIQELKKEEIKQKENKLFYGEYYFLQYVDEKQDAASNIVKNIISIQANIPIDKPKINFICIDENGSLTTQNSFKYASRVIRKDMGIKFNFHSLRHTHATKLIEAGANIKEVQLRLGHSSIKTTLDVYTKHTDEAEAELVNLFDNIL